MHSNLRRWRVKALESGRGCGSGDKVEQRFELQGIGHLGAGCFDADQRLRIGNIQMRQRFAQRRR